MNPRAVVRFLLTALPAALMRTSRIGVTAGLLEPLKSWAPGWSVHQVCRVAFMSLLVILLVGHVSSAELAEEVQTLIFLVDRSESIAHLAQPDTTLPFITQAIHVGALSGRQVRMAVIVFNGNGVKVIAGEDGKTTSALESLHKKLLQDWEKPSGATPFDQALTEAISLVKNAAPGRVTVVHFGDGCPESGRLRPEDFESVRKEIDRRVEGFRNAGYPPKTTQQLIDRFTKAMGIPGTEEFNQVYAIQRGAEFDLCKKHAATLRAAKVRFVSVDFDGRIPQLREIHDAAGGLAADYLVVQPANTVIKKLHELRLIQLNGIVVPKPVHIGPDLATFQGTIECLLDRVGEAAVLTVVFHEPIEDFGGKVDLSMTTAGVTHKFDVQNSDPSAILSFDNAGRVATATLVLPSMPPDGKAILHFRSPAANLHVPEMTVYLHLRLAGNLEPVFRPEHLPADRRPPYLVDPNRNVTWLAWLGVKDDPKPVPIKGIEAVWNNRSDGGTIRVEMEPDQQTPGVFRSPKKLQVPGGQYDLEVNFLLESGAQFRLIIAQHLMSQRNDEFIAIEIGQSSLTLDHIAAPELGDAVCEHEIELTVRAMNLDYPVTVEFSVVGLADPQGQSPMGAWVFPVRKMLTLQPGKAQPLTLHFRIPELIEDALEDGLYTAQLECQRLDLNLPMSLRPLESRPSASSSSVSDISFSLRRPKLSMRAPRGPRNALKREGNGPAMLTIHVDFGVPFQREIELVVEHDSLTPRSVTLTVEGKLQGSQRGQEVRNVSLLPKEGIDTRQDVPPAGSAKFRLVIDVSEPTSCRGMVRVSANGMRTVEVPVRIEVSKRPKGIVVQNTCYGLGALFLPLAGLAFWRRWGVARYGADREFVLSPKRPLPIISIEPASREQARLVTAPNTTLKARHHLDRQERRLPAHMRVSTAEVSPRNPLHLVEERPNNDGLHVAFNEIFVADDGAPEIHGEVIDGGRFQTLSEKLAGATRRRLVIAGICISLGYFFYTLPVLRAAQYVWDIAFHV